MFLLDEPESVMDELTGSSLAGRRDGFSGAGVARPGTVYAATLRPVRRRPAHTKPTRSRATEVGGAQPDGSVDKPLACTGRRCS